MCICQPAVAATPAFLETRGNAFYDYQVVHVVASFNAAGAYIGNSLCNVECIVIPK